GVADTWFNTVHEELANKMTGIYGGQTAWQGNYVHGVEVASLIAGDTNNGVGMASIGYNTKMVGYKALGSNAVYNLSTKPGVRVINMSWVIGYSQYEEQLYTEIRDSLGIVLVAAAGNGHEGNNCGGIDGNN